MNSYPIYIPSKGRANNQKTVKLLQSHGIKNYYVIVEQIDYKEYIQYIPRDHLIVLPGSNYGSVMMARNTAIHHSTKLGYTKHWQMDDDINKVYAHKLGKVIHTNLIDILQNIEAKELDKVMMVGLNTSASFLSTPRPKFNLNCSLTSIYLITNSTFRFRIGMVGDLDYVLQLLSAGYSTLKWNNFAFTFVTPLKQVGGYSYIHNDPKKRIKVLNEFLKLHPEVSSGIKKLNNGIYVLASIKDVWRIYKNNNRAQLLRKL